jgi:hypothetical protein
MGKINSLYASKYVDKELINRKVLGCSWNRILRQKNGKDHALLLVYNISTCP